MIHEGVRKYAFESFHQGSIVPDEATQPHLAIEDFMQKIFAGSLNRLVGQEPQQLVFDCRPA